MGLSEQMLRMSGIGGLQLGPIRWQGKANGKSVPPVDTPLPLQQVGGLNNNNRDDHKNTNSVNDKHNNNETTTTMITSVKLRHWDVCPSSVNRHASSQA